MVRVLLTLEELTLEVLGRELGGNLLNRGAVHPIRGSDRKKPGYSGHHRPWQDPSTTDFVALGFTAGELSGLTVWDCDEPSVQAPVRPNVLTARGWHIYTPYCGEKHLQPGVDGVDVLSNSNVVFWDDWGEKRVMTRTIVDSQVMQTWWESRSGLPLTAGQTGRIGTRTSKYIPRDEWEGTSTYAFDGLLLPEADYIDQVVSRGLSVDLGFVANGALMRLQASSEGTRNRVLYRESLRLVQCGIDPAFLVAAAEAVGLPLDEAEEVIRKAKDNYDPTRLPSVLDRVDSWVEAITHGLDPRLHSTVNEIARRAVHQNTTIPMVVQQDFPDAVVQSTISRRLRRLDHLGVVHAKPMGFMADGRRRSNCYELCLRRTVMFKDGHCVCSQL